MRSTTKQALCQAGVALSLVAVLSGCDDGPTTPGQSSSTAAQQRTAAPSTSPPTSTPAMDQTTGVSAGQTYTVREVAVSNGVGKTDTASSLELSGGDPRVTEVFNRGVRTYIQEHVDNITRTNDPRPHSVTTHAQIYFTETTVAEVIYGVVSYTGEAHPTKILGTITTNTRTATPILIGDLFLDRRAGITELAKATTEAMDAIHPGLSAAIAENLTPTDANFANWVPTPTALQVHIDTGRYVTGYPCVQIPWSRLTPVLGPTLKRVADQAPAGQPTACPAT
ncbi:hypothetical protein [Nocardia altamirensis]|uniref:hypothetical protein n=1 Tax=Nocardia altamirensis TaxID=472158 RepID=UPI0008401032|nr:hypothetical protein [Nocardia altamirensis]